MKTPTAPLPNSAKLFSSEYTEDKLQLVLYCMNVI